MSADRPFDPVTVPLSGKTLVEASAGTGKTYAITKLFLRLVVEKELLPSEILVVTFTEAATAELRGRIRRTLLDAETALLATTEAVPCRDPLLGPLLSATPSKLGKFRQLLERAVRSLDEASISTIHGFCHRVLHDHAFGTRTRFGSELVADLGDLEEDVLHDFFRREFSDGQTGLAQNMQESGIMPATLRTVLGAARKHSGARKIPDPQAMTDGTLRAVVEVEHRYLAWGKAELDARKERRGVLGFDDLLEHVGRALEGPGNDALVASLVGRYKAALVDEFQDTDSVQGRIFERIFARSGLPLFLIGDPKQAIYGFRGADVWSYLSLTRDAEKYTLGTSYRSDPSLVAAVNHVFSRPSSFLMPGIDYRPVTVREGRADRFDGPGGPVELLFIEAEEGLMGKAAAHASVNRVVAAEVAELLSGKGTLRDGSGPITESQIAVISRTNKQCFEVQEALRQKGIHSVVIADNDVLEADEAEDLLLVLPAVVDPTRRDFLRRAHASTLLGTSAAEVVELERDASQLDGWVERFQRWHTLWVERGFMRMIRALFDDTDVPRRLLAHPSGERQLTNYLHLCELLHRASTEEHLGPAALVSWLAEQRVDARGTPEHAEIRLESDEHAVRVLTAHKAKGLEFDVVICPYLWDSFGESNNAPGKLFHDGDEPVLDLHVDKSGREKNFPRVKWEAHAEERRVAYVALTRAKHRLTIVWCHARAMGTSAFCTLLHPPDVLGPTEMPSRNYPDKRPLLADLRALADTSNGSITLRTVPWNHDAPAVDRREGARTAPKARAIERQVTRFARTESFSALTKRARELEHELARTPDEDAAKDHDEAVVETEPEAAARAPDAVADNEPIDLVTFPRGRLAGDYFHAILEELDFTDPDGPAVFDLADAKLDAFGFARGQTEETRQGWLTEAVAALGHFLETPLAPAGAFRLADVPPGKRLNELEFRVPVAARPREVALTASRLAAAFQSHPSAELPKSYADRVGRLSFPSLNGFLKGYIDLVFEHDGRWYVVDYKTSHLGDTVGQYSFRRMQEEMAESHYFLQYHLYTLAVHRLLSRFQRGYDYERGFGGVLYLFLKGMRPGSPHGVFFEKPPLSRLDALGAALGGLP